LAVVDSRYTGGVECHFDEDDKLAWAAAVAAHAGVPLSACAAVGDSRSDLPLLANVGLLTAFTASPQSGPPPRTSSTATTWPRPCRT
jgi:phosphoserine phosphatase